MDLAKVLADLREYGASEAKVEFDASGAVKSLHVVIGGPARAARPAGFVNLDGEPVNLDEGMGALEVDPLEAAERAAEAAGGDPLHAKNFPKAKAPDAAS